jgi:ATP-dependent RNA helicase RhlE
VSSIAVYGGVPSEPQERALRAGADIVVATPGRLMDHMRGHAADFTGLGVLVLDEADRRWTGFGRRQHIVPPCRPRARRCCPGNHPAEVAQAARRAGRA